MTAPIPPNEASRLIALRRYGLLDTEPEPAFDELAALAADVLDAPIALVSLVDEERQWFKARCGLSARETPREQAFCAHVILGDTVMVVEDATKDPRFADNPLVTGPLNIRTYAGAPLIAPDGHCLGTLCVIYTEVTPVTPTMRRRLAGFAACVMGQMELKLLRQHEDRSAVELRTKDALLASIAEAARIGGWVLDIETGALAWTSETRMIHEVDAEFTPDLKTALQFYAPEFRGVVANAVERAIETGEPWELEAAILTARGRRRWVRTAGRALTVDGRAPILLGAS